jgi:hypothetical protein
MAFNRTLLPTEPAAVATLTANMIGIGMNFAASGADQPNITDQSNIEDTLFFASIEGMEKSDLRVLSILVTWFGIHAAWVNADRLTKLVGLSNSQRVCALWSALAHSHEKDRRFARLARLYSGPRQDVTEVGAEFQIKRFGEDPRFKGSAIRVAANVLRDRPSDVLSAVDLARRHRAYRWRVIMGPSYRADMWAALEQDASLSAAELARRTYGSFATAWRVRRDFVLLSKLPASSGEAKSA